MVGDAPLSASGGSRPSLNTDSSLSRSIPSASWQSAATVDPGPRSSDPANGTGHLIHLKSRQIEPSPANALSLTEATEPGQERMHVLVQLDYIPRQAAKEALQAQGLDLLAYVPDYAWIAALSASDAAAAGELPGVTWIGELTVDDKLDPAIREGRWSDYNLHSDGTAAVYVVMHGDETLDTGRALVEAHGGRVVGQLVGFGLLVVEMPRDSVRALAAEGAVQWIEPAGPPLTGSNDGIRAQIGVDIVNAAPYNLDGAGVNVLVYDSGQVGDHVDFGTRLIHGDGAGDRDHSTHVAGTVGGSGANSASEGGTPLQWRGMAPAVGLISYGAAQTSVALILFYEDLMDIEANWAEARDTPYLADLGTASLGSNIYYNYPSRCDLMGKYGASSVLIDQIVRGGNSAVGIGSKYITTWAAGNERGWGNDSCSTYSIVSPPAGAKNPIHVGGSNTNDNTQYAHTSWGPTEDGRLKPIVTAGACQTPHPPNGIESTDNSPVDGYVEMCGTSMATPAVAGGIALMLQHYRDVYNTSGRFWPSTAKAILMQTAQDLGNPGPDYQWGYGQVNIHAAVDLITRQAFRQDSVAHGAADLFYFIVPDDDPVTVSLAWDDHEATLNANPTLINDLDLDLVAPSGAVWRPWVLDPDTPTANATRGADHVNNQEQVRVPTPEIGTWTVRVRGTTVPQGPQDYSLVCEGCKSLTVGACQGTLAGTASAAGAEAEVHVDEQGEEVLLRSPAQLSEGELWQRALEAGTLLQEDAPRLVTEDGEVLYSAPGPYVRPVPDAGLAQEVDILNQALETLDAARAVGPEAVVALRETLPPQALDAMIAEIAEAQEWLGDPVPLHAVGTQLSKEQERALAEERAAADATSRARALSIAHDPAESEALSTAGVAPPSAGIGPAADRTVGSGCTYATIAAAISAANPGDRLFIEGGVTFYENVVVDRNLTLQGGYAGCASGSSVRTTIDGGGGGAVLVVSAGLDVTLENLNLTNGSAFLGGGIGVGINAQANGTNVHVYNNAALAGGGAVLYGGRMTLSNSSIHDNSAPLGGGVYGTLQSTYAPILNLSSVNVYQNEAIDGDGLGGGIYMRQGSVSLADDSDVYYNDAIDGGGVYLVTSTLTVGGSTSWIYYNTATGNGGGVYVQGGTINLDDGANLYGNDAGTDGTGSGGGAYLDDGNLYSDRASIRYNEAYEFGGGVYATNGSIVSMDLGTYTCLGVRCSRLYGNRTTQWHGGGIFAAGSTVHLYNTFVEANSANLGGGVYALQSTVYAYNSLFARNAASGATGDGVHDTGGAATGTAIGLSSASLTLSCSILWGHSTSIDSVSSTEDVTYSDVQGGYAGAGNLNVNPQFVASGGYDYHLQHTSPAIDRCPSGTSPDFENWPRPIVLSSAATPYDMGADEATGVARVGVNGTCAYATIQQAVNAAQEGDTVRVAAGVYFENVDLTAGVAITVEGGYNSTCTAIGRGTTRIEGSPFYGSTIDVSGGTVRLRRLQIAWGSGTGGGVDARSGAQVALENSDVLHNHGTYGGGIYVDSTSVVTMDGDSDVRGNTASGDGGGARVWGALYGYDTYSDIYYNCASNGGGVSVLGGTLYLDNSDVYGNEAANAQGRGGGIYVTSGGVVTLTNMAYVYALNRAYDGAGIHADASTVYLDGATTTLRDNEATHYGGGVYLANGSALYSNGARIGWAGVSTFANEALRGAGIYALNSTVEFAGTIVNNVAADRGGGIYANASTVILDGGHVLSNTAGAVGGGIRMWGASTLVVSGGSTIGYNESLSGEGGAIAAGGTPDIDITDATLLYNSASGYGGAIYLGAGTLDVSRAVLHHNSALRGGAIYQTGSAASIVQNSLIYANTTSAAFGAGIRAEGGGFMVTHVTLADNVGGAGYSQFGTSSWADNSIAWGNSHGGFGGAFVAASCNVDQNGNVGSNVDPQFVGGGDYHLAFGSPAVDACGSGISPDLDGVVRPNGPAYDMGAYESPFSYIYLPVILKE
jgi:predicted outer membrane repeat protein